MGTTRRHGLVMSLLGAVALSIGADAMAQVYEVKQVRESSLSSDVCWTDNAIFEAGELAVFIRDGEPWRTDGTSEGTFLLKELCPGLCETALTGAATLGGKGYFLARGNNPGLWSTDGTSIGTELVAPIATSQPTSDAPSILVLNGALVFVGSSGGSSGLWRSDGTAAGTVLLAAGAHAWETAVIAGRRLFFVDSTTHVLWCTDGTASGTRTPRDASGASFKLVRPVMAALGGSLLFLIEPAYRVSHLWRTDGSAAAAVEVKEWTGLDPDWIRASEGYALFSLMGASSNQVLRTDGTAAGTWLLVEGAPWYWPFPITKTLAAGGFVYFLFGEITGGVRPWVSDGTVEGTHDLNEWTGGSASLKCAVGGRALIVVDKSDPATTFLWASDGTQEGTLPLADVTSAGVGLCGSLGDEAICIGSGRLVRTDGTPGGTVVVESGRDGSLPSSVTSSQRPVHAGAAVLFTAYVSGGHCAGWRTDGTEAGTYALESPHAYSGEHLALMQDLNGTLLFRLGSYYNDWALWASDGTEAGTRQLSLPATTLLTQSASRVYGCAPDLVRVDDLQRTTVLQRFAARSDASCSPMAPFRGGVVFTGSDVSHGVEPWITDGTPTGAKLLADLAPGAASARFNSAFGFAGNVLLGAFGPPGGLWRSDATPEGTVWFSPQPGMGGPALWQDKVVFSSGGVSFTDGTAAGTSMVVFQSNPYAQRELHPAGKYVFVLDWTTGLAVNENKILVTDGTQGGTSPLVRWYLPPGIGDDPELTVAGDTLFFAFDDGVHGRELWKSDGTLAGTVMVKDIWPGALGSRPSSLVAADGMLYFAASDGVSGDELWRSDGTADGTVQVADICPGPCPSSPGELTVVGNLIFFDANGGTDGQQLWALRRPEPNADALDASAAVVSWGTTAASIDVVLSEPVNSPATVSYETTDGSALAGRDYEKTSGGLTFAPGGPPRQSIRVPLRPDSTGGFFFIHLLGARGAAVRRAFAEVTVSRNTGAVPRLRSRLFGGTH